MISKEFVLAGHAIFTAVGKVREYTFKVERADKDHPKYGATYFASVLTGPQNTDPDCYTYIGLVSKDGCVWLTKASRYTKDSEPVKALEFVLQRVWAGTEMPEGCSVRHCGWCGKCGRLLTCDESILSGIGPVCSGRGSRKKKGKRGPEIEADQIAAAD